VRPSEKPKHGDWSQRMLGTRSAQISVARLREEVPPQGWTFMWEQAVRLQDVAMSTPPKLHNADGDPLLLTNDRFDFAATDRRIIEAKLAVLAEDDEETEASGERVFTFHRPGNAMHKSWDKTVVGRTVLRQARSFSRPIPSAAPRICERRWSALSRVSRGIGCATIKIRRSCSAKRVRLVRAARPTNKTPPPSRIARSLARFQTPAFARVAGHPHSCTRRHDAS